MNATHTVTIDGSKITDFEMFHKTFKDALGFPGFYGANMNAWIDCVGDIHNDTGMLNVLVPDDVSLVLKIINTRKIEESDPEIIQALSFSTGFINTHHLKNQAPIYLIYFAEE